MDSNAISAQSCYRRQTLNEHQEFELTISNVTNLPKTLTAALSTSISCGHILRKTHKFSSAVKADDSALDSVVVEKLDRDFFQPERTTLESSCDAELTDRIAEIRRSSLDTASGAAFRFPLEPEMVNFVANASARASATCFPVFDTEQLDDGRRRSFVAILRKSLRYYAIVGSASRTSWAGKSYSRLQGVCKKKIPYTGLFYFDKVSWSPPPPYFLKRK